MSAPTSSFSVYFRSRWKRSRGESRKKAPINSAGCLERPLHGGLRGCSIEGKQVRTLVCLWLAYPERSVLYYARLVLCIPPDAVLSSSSLLSCYILLPGFLSQSQFATPHNMVRGRCGRPFARVGLTEHRPALLRGLTGSAELCHCHEL